jgi:hypothetical protein
LLAAGVDIQGLQSILAELQERYNENETSQLEMLSDTLLRTFKDASADLGKLLATKGLEQASCRRKKASNKQLPWYSCNRRRWLVALHHLRE